MLLGPNLKHEQLAKTAGHESNYRIQVWMAFKVVDFDGMGERQKLKECEDQ